MESECQVAVSLKLDFFGNRVEYKSMINVTVEYFRSVAPAAGINSRSRHSPLITGTLTVYTLHPTLNL